MSTIDQIHDRAYSTPVTPVADKLDQAVGDLHDKVNAQLTGLDPCRKDDNRWCLRHDPRSTLVEVRDRPTDGADGPYRYDTAEVEFSLKIKVRPGDKRQVREMLEQLGYYIERKMDLEL